MIIIHISQMQTAKMQISMRIHSLVSIFFICCSYRLISLVSIWATSRENLFMPYANNKGADQPAHMRILISAFVVCCLGSLILPVSISEIWSLYLAFVAAQAGLSLPWSQTPKIGFLVTMLISKIPRLLLASSPEQASLSLSWSHIPENRFLVMWLICFV